MKPYCELCGDRKRKRAVEPSGETLCTKCSAGKKAYEAECKKRGVKREY